MVLKWSFIDIEITTSVRISNGWSQNGENSVKRGCCSSLSKKVTLFAKKLATLERWPLARGRSKCIDSSSVKYLWPYSVIREGGLC